MCMLVSCVSGVCVHVCAHVWCCPSCVCVYVCVPVYMRASALTVTLARICRDTFHPTGINVKVWMQGFNNRKHYRVLKASFRKAVFGQGVFAFTAE